MPARFVWLSTRGRISAEKWPADSPACANYQGMKGVEQPLGRALVAEHLLSDAEEALSIDDLKARYPQPGAEAVILDPVKDVSTPLGFWE